MELSGAEIVIRLLERQRVDTITGIPGGANLPLYDALGESRIRHVLARSEQGAGFIAQGMARRTGRAAVTFASSGPGVTNLVTALADAKCDSIPLIAITGQVPTGLIGTDAFQEVDTVGITRSITKKNFFVRSVKELLEVVPAAFSVAESGRPGPVLIDLPKDVQSERARVADWPAPGGRAPMLEPDSRLVAELARAIERAERPILYVGGGVIASGAHEAVRALAHRIDAFVVSTLNGLGAFPNDDPLFLGMLGMHGAPHTNLALEEADLLIALGARFDDRATGKPSEFCTRATIAHVDVDPREIGKIKRADIGIAADLRLTLERLLEQLEPKSHPCLRARVAALAAESPPASPGGNDLLDPWTLLKTLSSVVPRATVVTTDVGQHQMWVAQYYPFTQPRTLLSSGGLGTMGFGLPAAIGAALTCPEARVLCITGDGSLLMNVQELATLAELELPVAVIVLDNGHLGLVRQQQELFYGERYLASRFHHETDFVALARGFGLRGVKIDGHTTERGLADLLRAPGPILLHVPIPPFANVLPMVPPGAANRDMIRVTPARGLG